MLNNLKLINGLKKNPTCRLYQELSPVKPKRDKKMSIFLLLENTVRKKTFPHSGFVNF